MPHADLELSLHLLSADQYVIGMRLDTSRDDADRRLDPPSPPIATLDDALAIRLRALELEPTAYGTALTEAIFADPQVKDFYRGAIREARDLGTRLRFCLAIPRSAPHLHRLRWETLRDPLDVRLSLTTRQDVVFFRYLSVTAEDLRPVRPHEAGEPLASLLVIAGGDLGRGFAPGGRALAPIDVAGERERARASLDGTTITELTQPGEATLDRIAAALRDGCDVLYLVCHGALIDDRPVLYLDDATGKTVPVKGEDLVTRVRELSRQPRLCVLASCQSAGGDATSRSDDGGALAGLGPRLSEAGVPAVVAMQGNVLMSTVAKFMPAFFKELAREGAVDAAMAAARGEVRDKSDFYMPVLFTRLRAGRVWHQAGAEGGPGKWNALLGDVEKSRDTPALGPGGLEPQMVLAEGRYELLQRIDVGGSTSIWKAFDRRERRPVALKVLKEEHAGDEDRRRRYVLGIDRAAALPHPGITRVFERAREEGALVYAALEFVPGGSLEEAVLSGALTGVEALRVLLPVGDAIEHARRHGHVRGAVTPRRVLLDADDHAKLLDSGLVATADDDSRRVAGPTFVYTAPEAVAGAGPVDAPSDVYGLAMTAVFCLHGQALPLEATADPPAFVDRLGCSEPVKAALRRAVSRRPEDRWPAVADLCRALEAALQTENAASPGSADAQPFVGRERQLARLHEWLAQAAAGHTQVGLVAGDAGAGKTALLRAFAGAALDAPASLLVVVGHCDARTGKVDAYAPFIEIFTQLTGGAATGPTQSVLQAEHARQQRRTMRVVLEALARTAPHLVGPLISAPALEARAARILGGQEAWVEALKRRVEAPDPDESIERGQTFRECAELLSALAAKRTLLIIVEDLHWADSASIDLFAHLALELKERRVFLLGSLRIDEVAHGRDGKQHPLAPVLRELKRAFGEVTVDLGACGPDERRDFVFALIDTWPNRLDAAFREAICEHTGGHPLFTLEILRTLRERGHLAQDEPFNWNDLPAKVEGVIEERIERLEPEMRDLLEVASVEGREFTAQVVGKIENKGERELLKSLSRELESRHRLVQAGATARMERVVLSQYSFTNGLYQTYLYDHLTEADRVDLHRQIAGALEDFYKDRAEQVALQLAHHHDKAGNVERAIEHYLVAGKRALRMSAYFEARRSLSCALKLLPSLAEGPTRDHRELELRGRLATIDKATQGWAKAEAKDEYDQLSRHVDDPRLQSSALLDKWVFDLVQADLHGALDKGKELLQIAERTRDRGIEAAARMAIANASFWLGDLRETRGQAEALERIWDAEGFRDHRVHYGHDPYVTVQMMRAWAEWLEGRPLGALRMAEENVARAEPLEHPFSLAIALTTLAWQHLHLRDADATLAVAERLIALSRERTFPSYVGLGVMLRGWAVAQRGREAEGAAAIEEGFAAWSATAGRLTTTFKATLLADVHLRAGRLDDALGAASRGLDAVRDHDERPYGPELWRLKGECLAAGPPAQRDEALACFSQALADACALGAVMLELRAAVSLGRHARSPEERARAREALASACERVAGGDALPDLVDARRTLAALEAP